MSMCYPTILIEYNDLVLRLNLNHQFDQSDGKSGYKSADLYSVSAIVT